MTSPSNLPPLAEDDELAAKAHWTHQCNQAALKRLFSCMRNIQDSAEALDKDEVTQSQALDAVAYHAIHATINHLVTQLLTCRTLGQHDEEERIDCLIADLYGFADKLDDTDD